MNHEVHDIFSKTQNLVCIVVIAIFLAISGMFSTKVVSTYFLKAP